MHGLQASCYAFMLSRMKLLLKREVGGHVINSHRNYIVDHGKSWKNHGIVLLNLCGNPEDQSRRDCAVFASSVEPALFDKVPVMSFGSTKV